MLAAENIQRQITIAVVVTMEEPAFLFAMQRQIGRIDIDNHLFRRLVMRFDEHRHQQLIDTVFPECDFLVPIRHAVAEFHPIQSALARQRSAEIFPAGQHTEQRIQSQILSVDFDAPAIRGHQAVDHAQ